MTKRLALIAICSLLIASCEKPVTTGVAITNVTIIDAVNGVRGNQTVVIEEDAIIRVQPSNLDVPPVTQSIDGTGKFLIPGLWDFHVHLTFDDTFTGIMPALFLSYGVTSVRDTGGLMHKILPVVEQMRTPNAIAPRVFFSGPLLDGEFVVYDGISRPEIGTLNDSPEAAQARVTQLKAQGVDFIKIYEMVTPEVFQAMVEAANKHSLPIDSHVPLSMRASTAGPQVDSIEHLRNIELDCNSDPIRLQQTRVELLKNQENVSGYELRSSLHSLQRLPAVADYDEERCNQALDTLLSTTQVPTLRLNAFSLAPPFDRSDWESALSRLPMTKQEEWRPVRFEIDKTFGEWSLFLTGRMHERGIPIGAGTDTPIALALPGYSLHSELEMLVRAGLPPLEAIRSATLRPAEYFSLENEMGTVDVGMRADLVLLNANPLDDISNTKQISLVVSKGIVFEPESLITQ